MIIDHDSLRTDASEAAVQILSAGVRFIQYRNKSSTRRAIYETALGLCRLVHEAGGLFIVNDHADIALAVAADGVHLGQDDLPIEYARKLLGREMIIGISTHSMEQARKAEAEGADYIGLGPIFSTASKNAGQPLGIVIISDVRQRVSIPIIAIGGITDRTIPNVIGAGADGAAVISAVLSAEDMRSAASRLVLIAAEARAQ